MDKFSRYYLQMDKSTKQTFYPNSSSTISVNSTPQEMSDFVMRNVKERVDKKLKELSILAEGVKSHPKP